MKSLTCPSCGANLEAVNERFLQCPYCDTNIVNEYYDPNAPAVETEEEGEEIYLDDLALDMLVTMAEEAEVGEITDVVYANFIENHKKLQAARTHFQIPADDDVYLIYDGTVFGSCKKGFALTTSGVHYNDEDNHLGSYTWEEFMENDVSYASGELFMGEARFICGTAVAEQLGDFMIAFNESLYNTWYADEA